MDPVFDAFGAKVAALTPMVRPGLLASAQTKLMKARPPTAPKAPMPGTFGIKTSGSITDSTTASHEDPLPSTFKGLARKKEAMVHPSMQEPSETMTPGKWKQTFKDVPLSILAGGVGYGIGRTLTEVIGESLAKGGTRPGWSRGVPLATAAISAAGAYAASRARDGLKKRREESA